MTASPHSTSDVAVVVVSTPQQVIPLINMYKMSHVVKIK